MILDPLSPEIIKPVTEAPSLRNPFDEFNIPTLLPTVPAQAAVTNTDVNSDGSNPDYYAMINKSLDTNRGEMGAPLYEMKTSQLERYDNPYLPYTPAPQGFKSIEGAYGANQGAGEQFLNAFLKFGAVVGGTIVGGFAGVPNQIDSLRKGDVSGALFGEDTAFSTTQRILEALENELPNYLTDIEQDREWYVNALTPTGAANFWFDTVLKNGAFTVGSIANAVIADAGISVLTGGSATPVAVVDFGRRIATLLPKMKSVFRGIAKSSALRGGKQVTDLMSAGENMVQAVDTASKISMGSRALKGAHVAATTYFGAQGEAMVEGYGAYVETKTKLLEEALQKGEELTPELLNGIEETASHAGKNVAILNAIIVGASQLHQFSSLLGWKKLTNLAEPVSTPYVKYTLGEKGLDVINTYSRKQAIKNVLTDIGVKGFISEGLEEGGQYYVGNSLHDYYVDKFNNETKDNLIQYMANAIPETLADKDFWKEAIIGGLSGTITGTLMPGSDIQASIKGNLFGARARAQGYVSVIKDNLDLFNSEIEKQSTFEEIVDYNKKTKGNKNVFINKHEATYKALHRVVADAYRFGNSEQLLDTLQDLKSINLDEFNKLFTVGYGTTNGPKGVKTEADKNKAIDAIITEAEFIKRDIESIEESMLANPFDTKATEGNLRNRGYKEEDIKQKKIDLFNDWKRMQVYTMGRLRNIEDTKNKFKEEIKLGSNPNLSQDERDQIADFLLNFNTGESVTSYLDYKSKILNSLQTQIDLYAEDTSLGNKQTRERLRVSKKRLQKLLDQITEIGTKADGKLSPDDIRIISELILKEEFTNVSIENIKEVVENFTAIKKVEDNAIDDLNTDPEKKAGQMLDVEETLETENKERKLGDVEEIERKQKEKEKEKETATPTSAPSVPPTQVPPPSIPPPNVPPPPYESEIPPPLTPPSPFEEDERFPASETPSTPSSKKKTKGGDENFPGSVPPDIAAKPPEKGLKINDAPVEKSKQKAKLESLLKTIQVEQFVVNKDNQKEGEYFVKAKSTVKESKVDKEPYFIIYQLNEKLGGNESKYKPYKVKFNKEGFIEIIDLKKVETVSSFSMVSAKNLVDAVNGVTPSSALTSTKVKESQQVKPKDTQVINVFPSKRFISDQEKIEIISKIKTHSNLLYYDIEAKEYRKVGDDKAVYNRVTKVIEDKDVNKQLAFTGAEIGDKLDVIIRDFFMGAKEGDIINKLKEMIDPLTTDPEKGEEVKERIAKQFFNELNELAKQFNKKGEQVITEPIVVHSDSLMVAGTLDILTIDNYGDVRIYDLKSLRSGITYYESPYINKETNKPEGLSRRESHTRQLSMYAYLLKESLGIDVKAITIVPVKTAYGEELAETSELKLLDLIPLEKRENLKDIVTNTAFESIAKSMEEYKTKITENIEKFVGEKTELAAVLRNALNNKLFIIDCK